MIIEEKDVMIRSINGVTVPEPGLEAKLIIADESDSGAGRSMSGHLWKGFVGEYYKLQCSTPSMRYADISTLLTALRRSNGFPVAFFDWTTGEETTDTFVVGDRNINPLDFRGPNKRLAEVSFNLTSVDLHR